MAIRTTTPALHLAALILAAVPAVSKADFNTMPGQACIPLHLEGNMRWTHASGGAIVNMEDLGNYVTCPLTREKANNAPLKRVEVNVEGGVRCMVTTHTANSHLQSTGFKVETQRVKTLVFTDIKTVARGTASALCRLEPGASLYSVVWIE